LGLQAKNALSLKKKMEVAIAIGVSPIVILGSQARVPFGFDELTVAGGLAGTPVELVPCHTVELHVPADSEIVIEGEFDPNVLEPEGVFAEYPGYYGPIPLTPVIEVKAITHRKNPIFLAGLTGKPATENHYLRALPMETELFHYSRRVSENVRDVYMLPGGATFMAAVSILQTRPFEARQVLLAMLASRARCKYVVAVDDDVDIHNPNDVLWAIATRSQPDKDVILVSDVPLCELDPSAKYGGSGAMAIDATKPFGEEFEEASRIPGVERVPDLLNGRGAR
jgi:UbiD family decarboxylase